MRSPMTASAGTLAPLTAKSRRSAISCSAASRMFTPVATRRCSRATTPIGLVCDADYRAASQSVGRASQGDRDRLRQPSQDRLDQSTTPSSSLLSVLGACPSSRCSSLSEFDLTLDYEQALPPLEYRSDVASAAECAGLRSQGPCLVDGGQDPRKDGAAKFSGMKFGG